MNNFKNYIAIFPLIYKCRMIIIILKFLNNNRKKYRPFWNYGYLFEIITFRTGLRNTQRLRVCLRFRRFQLFKRFNCILGCFFTGVRKHLDISKNVSNKMMPSVCRFRRRKGDKRFAGNSNSKHIFLHILYRFQISTSKYGLNNFFNILLFF